MHNSGTRYRHPADFWDKTLVRGDCLVWPSASNRGRGQLSYQGKTWLASRLAFFLSTGPIPAEMKVWHRCDNPRCVRPAHLFLGTHTDNMADMAQKGRARPPRGEAQHLAKITLETARRIKSLISEGHTAHDIAQCTGSTVNIVKDIRRGKTWKQA